VKDFDVDLGGLSPIRRQLDRLSRRNTARLLEVVGATVESQTRRRIESEKRDPSGQRWKRRAGGRGRHPLLERSGALVDSITFAVHGDVVEVGSNLIYARTHQRGDQRRRIPARAFLGLSEANKVQIGRVVERWAKREGLA